LSNTVFLDPFGLRSQAVSTVFFVVIGAAIVYAISFGERAAHRLAEERDRLELIANASAEIDRSLDYQTTLAAVTRMVVPRVADWCVIHVVEAGVHERVAVAHLDAAEIERARRLWESLPYDPDAARGIPLVLRTGEPELVSDIRGDRLAQDFPDPLWRTMMHEFGICSYLVLPLKRAGVTFGILLLSMSTSGRHYDHSDLPFASTLAARASTAIERARLYREADLQRERAELASQAKDQFLAMLGHELRNPLAPIRTALELMKMREPGSLTKERTVIERQVGQLTTLVDDLLDIARITRGAVELHRRPTMLSEVVAKGVETASPLVETRRHELHISVEPGLSVDGDPERLAQVVGNLVTNAAKYTEPGGRIDITAKREGDRAVVRVRDSGIGITSELLPHIFEMFVQAPQALDRARGGIGLGLAIVRSLVELHGGTVQATSEGPGKGSVFEVDLPALAKLAPRGPLPAERGTAWRGRVLVVDDNPDALSLLADALESRGYLTARAHDGPSALAVASQVHPEIALLDIGLPVMDGYELARRLHERDRAVKLVAVTGYGQPGDFERTQQAGFSAHLVKPISLDAVQATIERLVE
ncbi:MAG: hybrid sensor histidine kinase/response regulator, partial [Kofleriaceae bacterium]